MRTPETLPWHRDENGAPRYRDMPLNLADRRQLLARPLTPGRKLLLKWLDAEFEILKVHGVIFAPSYVRALESARLDRSDATDVDSRA